MGKRPVAALAAVAMVLAACGGDDSSSGDESTSPSEQSGEQLQEGTQPGGSGPEQEGEADPNAVVRLGYDLISASTGGFSFDPTAPNGTVAQDGPLHWVFGALLRPTPDGEAVPGLAESAEVVDKNTIEVVLREGLTLSDGTPLTAEMVKSSLERSLANDENTAFEGGFYALESIEITEPNTLMLSIPNGTAPTWYRFLSEAETLVIPEGTDFEQPVGAGPYVVAEFVPQEKLVFEKNPEYWNADDIQVSTLELVTTTTESQSGVNAARAGQVDWTRINFTQTGALEGTEVEVQTLPDPQSITHFLVCTTMEPVDDARVRQALSYAIDREAIVEAIFDGAAVPAWDLWPEGHRLHNEELTGYYSYDPERARELLEEAGHPDGFSIDVIPIASSPTPEVTQVVQQQWAEIGVDLNIVQSANFVQDALVNPSAHLAVVPTSGPGLFGKIDGVIGGGVGNLCGYENPEIARLRGELQAVEPESDEAVELWGELQEVAIAEEARNILVAFGPKVYAYDAEKLGGYELMPYVLGVPDVWQLYVPA